MSSSADCELVKACRQRQCQSGSDRQLQLTEVYADKPLHISKIPTTRKPVGLRASKKEWPRPTRPVAHAQRACDRRGCSFPCRLRHFARDWISRCAQSCASSLARNCPQTSTRNQIRSSDCDYPAC